MDYGTLLGNNFTPSDFPTKRHARFNNICWELLARSQKVDRLLERNGNSIKCNVFNRSILYGEYDPTTQKSQILNSSLWGLPRAYMKGMKHVFLDFGPINGPKRPKWAKTAENPHFWPKNETTIKITFNHQKCTRFGLCS